MTLQNIQIREAVNTDFCNIMDIEKQAFGSEEEAILVADLLEDKSASPIVSLLAFYKNEAIGHILFTRAYVSHRESPHMAYILAPLAVKPDFQKKGVGGQLIKAGLNILREKGCELVFVLGHKAYYPKYGFIPDAKSLGFPAPYPIPDKDADAWMVQPLTPDGLKTSQGIVRCADQLDKPEYWKE